MLRAACQILADANVALHVDPKGSIVDSAANDSGWDDTSTATKRLARLAPTVMLSLPLRV